MICISQLKRFARMMTSYVMTLYEVNRDPRTPLLPRIIIIIALGYALSPIDFIPDFIPVIGYFDDLIVIPLLIYIARRLIPLEIWNELSFSEVLFTARPDKT